MAEETNTIEVLIADMRRRIKSTPGVGAVFESVLEHLERADMTEAEHEEIIGWLHFAVRSPRMAELVYGMAQLVQAKHDPASPTAASMRN